MKGCHVLVTGGAGYVGSVLCRTLLERGCRVTVLDSFLHRQPSLIDLCSSEAFEVERGDCREEGVLKGLLRGKDAIIPLAAVVGAPACERDRTAAASVNLDAVRLLCRLASPSQWILFPSTQSAYGTAERGKPCAEDAPLAPLSFYARTKVEAEKAVLDRGNSVALRLATVFGASPRMRVDLLVNDFAYRAATDRAVVVFEGRFQRNFVHVRDAAGAFAHCLENFGSMAGRPYNAGREDANVSKLELCELIARQVPGFAYLEAPVGRDPDRRDYSVSNARMYASGWRPGWTLEAGIRELLKAFRAMPGRPFSNQ
jgi:nucleoside-diphosphate-sugar epimerase